MKKFYEYYSLTDVKRLVIYSRDELKRFEMSQLYTIVKYPQIRFFIGDVRDGVRFKRACDGIDIQRLKRKRIA